MGSLCLLPCSQWRLVRPTTVLFTDEWGFESMECLLTCSNKTLSHIASRQQASKRSAREENATADQTFDEVLLPWNTTNGTRVEGLEANRAYLLPVPWRQVCHLQCWWSDARWLSRLFCLWVITKLSRHLCRIHRQEDPWVLEGTEN